MALTQAQFCQVLSRLNGQQSGSVSALQNARYGLGRLAGALQLAQRDLIDEATSAIPRGLTIPIDTNLYTELITICPGLFPPLPADAARAAIILSALQALLQSDSPGTLLNTMLGDPRARLERVGSLLSNLTQQLKSIASSARSGSGLRIPGLSGGVVNALATEVKNEATALASRALLDALEKAGINPEAAQRCSDRLCAVGVRYNPPG